MPTLRETIAHDFGNETMRLAWGLLPGSPVGGDAAATALRRRGLRFTDGSEFAIDDVDGWRRVGELGRSKQREAHMLSFCDCVLSQNVDEARVLFYEALNMVRGWDRVHGGLVGGGDMAYHDETTARRLCFLTQLYFAACRLGEMETGWIKSLSDREFSTLSDPAFHAGSNNHGMFQDLALITHSVLFGREQSCRHIPIRRLVDYFTSSVTSDGVHREHSPAYHYVAGNNIHRYLPLLSRLDQQATLRLADVRSRMRKFASHILLPNGQYPPFGDTAPVAAPGQYEDVFGIAEGGALDQCAMFEEGGYAILRGRSTPDGTDTYMALLAAYHGNYHKHQDDLQLVIWRDGWVVGDAGPYGYDYEDPLSIHAYSSAAHSTLCVPGMDASRETGWLRLKRIYHRDYGVSVVRGESRRIPGVAHVRQVRFDRRDATVTVDDSVCGGISHARYLLWQLDPDTDVVCIGNEVHLIRAKRKIAKIHVDMPVWAEMSVIEGREASPLPAVKFQRFGEVRDAQTLVITAPVGARDDGDRFDTTATISLAHVVPRGMRAYVSDGPWPVQWQESMCDASEHLVVVFPGWLGANQHVLKNAVWLDHLAVNAMHWIDDIGEDGSCLISVGGDESLGRAVAEQIEVRRKALRIAKENVHLLGAGRGGTTAIWMTEMLGYGNLVAGAPNTLLGTHLCVEEEERGRRVAEWMCRHEDRRVWLDALVFGTAPGPDIRRFVHVSDTHPVFKVHVVPYVDHIRKHDGHIELDVGDREPSPDGRLYFNAYCLNHFQHLGVGGDFDMARAVALHEAYLLVNDAGRQLRVRVDGPRTDFTYAYYLYRGRDVIEKQPYTNDMEVGFSHEVQSGERYHARVFVRRKERTLHIFNSSIFEVPSIV